MWLEPDPAGRRWHTQVHLSPPGKLRQRDTEESARAAAVDGERWQNG